MGRIINETNNDSLLVQLKRFIKKRYIPKMNHDLSAYKKIFNHLTISDEGLIMKHEKIILPQTLWNLAIQKAHQGAHPGMSGKKQRIRNHFWFPKLDTVIEQYRSKTSYQSS